VSPINILALGLLNNKNTEVKIIKKIDNNLKKKLSTTIELYIKVEMKKNKEYVERNPSTPSIKLITFNIYTQ
jgi:hypothetical protein